MSVKKYLGETSLASLWAKIKALIPTKTSDLTNDSGYITNAGVTGVKGNSESTYRTGQVNLTAANIGAIPSNSNGNTQNLLRPLQLNGLGDFTLDAKINTLRANRLAFLPADQIIIEKTTDGGSTWTDAGVADSTKVGLFSETRAGVSIPLLNGVKDIKCGLRITITGMKYNVPSGTAETSKYNYWNSNYVVSAERYNQLKEMYFWVSANSDTISVKVERANGAASTTWNTIFDNSSYGMTGWSGNDYIRFAQGVFGGGTYQTGNYWNYRLTFFTRGPGGSTTLSGTNTTSAQSINEIRGYGDTWWVAGNKFASDDHLYSWDYLKNATFPAKVTATGDFSGNVTGTASGNLTSVQYDSTNAKLTYTKNGTNTDIVTVATLRSAMNIPTVPTNISAFTNDAGYVQGRAEYNDTTATIGTTAGSYFQSSFLRVENYGEGLLNQVFVENNGVSVSSTGGSVFINSSDQVNVSGNGGVLITDNDSEMTEGIDIMSYHGGVSIYNVVTPTSSDMAASKGYVDSAIPSTVSSFTNDAGYLTLATLPIYNGSYSQINS